MNKIYKVMRNHRAALPIEVGAIVHRFTGHDYGSASTDTLIHQLEYISVSVVLDKSPFFTIPLEDLELIDDRVCVICDGGPGNECACFCGMEKWEHAGGVADENVQAVEPSRLHRATPTGRHRTASPPIQQLPIPHTGDILQMIDDLRAAVAAQLGVPTADKFISPDYAKLEEIAMRVNPDDI